MKIYPVITLYQPWATWIMRGWKTIETRTHNKFACLNGRTILIHAGQRIDATAAKNPYLTPEQIMFNPDEVVNGVIIGSVQVIGFSKLSQKHSKSALIDCGPQFHRFGLFLENPLPFANIPCKGEMGIWYYDLIDKRKVSVRETIKS